MGVRLVVRSCWGTRSEVDAVFELEQTRILIGRGRGADVRLPHRAVSVRHATIELSGARYVLTDHETTNGTRVQGARIVPGRPKPLRDGDRIELGGFAIVFSQGIPVSQPMSTERTASLARRLAREALEHPMEALRPSLTIVNGPEEGRLVPIGEPPLRWVIGRGEEADLQLNDADASRAHAELEASFDGFIVRDLGSKNGVRVNGRPVDERLLGDRDEVQIGATVLTFEDPATARIEALGEGDDERVEAPAWEEVAPPEPDNTAAPGDTPSPDAEGEADEAPTLLDAPPPAPPPRQRGVQTLDMVIYVLAACVFVLSALGLVWLLRGG